ncbi:MAG TPA: hypothetical protein PKI11_16950 [Candidatus Hydrogenedentes bacterium]|nr:hypothetical protein [Candidatus Hydrogenedentota bacterium]
MAYQHDAQLANIVTSYCTCFGGILPLLFTAFTRRHPARWVFVYACVLITGVPTVWLHAMEGNRVASLFDVGTNILLAYAIQIAFSLDFLQPRTRRTLIAVMAVVNLLVWTYLALEVRAVEKTPLLNFGGFGQFYAGEVALILNAWVAVGVIAVSYAKIPRHARPLFWMFFSFFLAGMLIAAAGNDQISIYIFPWHAFWHVLGCMGFITLWVFNHHRFFGLPEVDSGRGMIHP